MTHIIIQVLSTIYQSASRSRWTRIGIATTMLAFCPAFFPVASANCGGIPLPGARLQAIPSAPRTTGISNQSSAASAPKTLSSIVGLWNVNFISGGQVVDVAFDAWHSDGTEILNDYTDPIEGNVCLGVWKQTGPRAYKLTHPSWYFDTSGTLQGTIIIHETLLLGSDGNSFSGGAIEDVYDTEGKFLYELTADVSATRIKVD
ncbi:MAG TPA: hypothetical protein VI386_14195 [Candidatus Sulfotelmatobacter sp.]